MPYTFRQLLEMPNLPGWETVAPTGLQYIGGMARDAYSADEVQSLLKFSLAKIEVRRLQLLQQEFERQGGRIRAGTMPDIYAPLRELTRFLLPHIRFERVDLANDRDARVLFARVDADAAVYVDVDDLSSGEKAVITLFYPFLEAQINRDLTLTAGSDPVALSTTLIDEPEIHLHPSLQTSLVAYLRQLAREGRSQFILTTHSPTILDALDQDEFYMLAPISFVADGNQFVRVTSTEERLEAIRSLTGATHLVTRCRPVIFVEGQTPSEAAVTDQRLLETLLDEAKGWVVVPSGGRSQAVAAASKLRVAAVDGLPGVPVFALVDADQSVQGLPDFAVGWPVAQIENLLLDAEAIWAVIEPMRERVGLANVDAVRRALNVLADNQHDDEVRLRVPSMTGPIKTEKKVRDLSDAESSLAAIRADVATELARLPSSEELAAEIAAARQAVDDIERDDRRLERFRGKQLLRTFYDEYGKHSGMSYPGFVYSVAAEARDRPRLVALAGDSVRRIQSYVPIDVIDALEALEHVLPEEDRDAVSRCLNEARAARTWWATGHGNAPSLSTLRAEVSRCVSLASSHGLTDMRSRLLRAMVQLGLD
jgi:hypothetical protein